MMNDDNNVCDLISRPDTRRKTDRLIFGSVFTWHWYSPMSLSWNKSNGGGDGNHCGDDDAEEDGGYGKVPGCIVSAKSNCPTFLHGGTKTC